MSPLVVLVTGASTGIGRAVAERLHAHGDVVVGVSRTISEQSGVAFERHDLDVTDEPAVEARVAAIVAARGRLDAVVSAAGYVLAGAIEDTPTAVARAQLATDLHGAMIVARAALPAMRRAGRGTIVQIGSIAGLVPMPFQGWYSASKAALTAASRALRLEVAPYGVSVVVVEPGDFRTPVTDNRVVRAPAGSVYAETFARTLAIVRRDETSAAPPDAVAACVERVLRARRPRATYLVGPWHQRAAARLRPMVPARLFDALLARLYGL
jgi:NAD(P)-dependent dehydrogenase (short-subunit alcohol dehydrogenase family)